MKKYPKCFPDNFETEILPEDAKEENKSVYRIIKSGIIDRDSFISTYEEMERGLIPRKKKLDLKNAQKSYNIEIFAGSPDDNNGKCTE